MHPIERLRYVARSSGASQEDLVRETAGSLGAFAEDPSGLVTACRRIVARHPVSGPLWWLCSRVLCAPDPMREAWQAAGELEADRTARELAHALGDRARVLVLGWPELVGDALRQRGDLEVLVADTGGEGHGLVRRLQRLEVDAVEVAQTGLGAAAAHADVVLLEASIVGPAAFVSAAGAHAAAAVARCAGNEVWLTAGVGRLVPGRIWEVVAARLDAAGEPWDLDDEVVPLDLVTQVVGPAGPESAADALRRTDTPVAPELFKEGVL